LAFLRAAMSRETPGALDECAALAVRALSEGQPARAAAAAGTALLMEHLRSVKYLHAPRMLGVLASVGPDACDAGDDGLLAWAGAAIAHDYGVLPSWPRPDISTLVERAVLATADVSLALACALGEVCERNGHDAEFCILQAQMAGIETHADASPLWRGYWAITTAWTLVSAGRRDDGARKLADAESLAAQHGLPELGVNAGLQRARLVEWRRDPEAALVLAEAAVVRGNPAAAPLWWADHADIQCRIALRAANFHEAVGHARRAAGFLRAAAVWPGYATTYRVNEAYALIGAGAFDEALACFAVVRETPVPRYLGARLACLVDLSALCAADQRGCWTEPLLDQLADVLRRLRELEWPDVMPLLPQYIARLFARALRAGIEPDWVRAAIRLRRLAPPPGAPRNWPWQVVIHTFGTFRIDTGSGPLPKQGRDARKASSKPLDLLRYLSARAHDATPIDLVAEQLWPGDGREGRHKAFDITVARLRQLLGSDAAVSVKDRRVCLNPQCVWIDTSELVERLREGETEAEDSPAVSAALEAALSLYGGPCLADSREVWAVAARESARSRLAALMLRASRSGLAMASKRTEWALRAIAADPDIARLIGART